MEKKVFAEVIVDNKSTKTDRLYTYIVPDRFENDLKVGMRVLVPFGRGNKKIEGLVVNIKNDINIKVSRLKYIDSLVDNKPILSQEMIKLGLWMKKKYLAQYIDVFKTLMPTGITNKVVKYLKLNENIDECKIQKIKSINQRKIIEYLKHTNKADVNTIKRNLNIKNIISSINSLCEKEIIEMYEEIETEVNKKYQKVVYRKFDADNKNEILKKLNSRAYKQKAVVEFITDIKYIGLKELMIKTNSSLSTIKALRDKGYLSIKDEEVKRNPINNKAIVENKKLQLTNQQKECINTILKNIEKNKCNKFLIHGVTGSGKTEVYLRLIERMLKWNKQAIVLVPEISLTPQTVERFVGRFGDKVAVLHSRLSLGERYDEWRKIKEGKVQIAVGARSAVFAPFDNLGLIVIDEEHENSYKSSMSPKYNTLEVAEKRCKLEGATLILGSATPSIESYYRSLKNELKLLKLTERANKKSLPPIEVVDMRKELDKGNKSIFSEKLLNAIKENLENNKQTILFLNRRGFSTFVSCRKCGYVAKCKQCDISLTYHMNKDLLKCHYCGFTMRTPRICPECGSEYIKYFGVGTEKIEEVVKHLFPTARVERMDVDTTSRKGSHEKILNKVKNGNIDILIGTQMITKGLDFHNVTLVGIIAADMTLNLPDFRAAERTFQLTTQVSGRAGRGEAQGRVILQTYEPEHYSITTSQAHNYVEFYEKEIKIREEFEYPPFTNIINIVVTSKDEKKLYTFTKRLFQHLDKTINNNIKKVEDIELIGPNPAPLSRIKGSYRWQILIKCKNSKIESVKQILEETITSNKFNEYFNLFKISIDINPNSIM
ncbi:primosomal protein N' [Caldisalinibacter kiritimatiensis]|uniref:Replication restart protein PriA n=1 Tax=Caldisalinibacter kiritimatiensis TaxID=1304284 RepID=R1AXC3_9FIRM|nr:primosomal protein N' [Caldisalinibacter kiritimatiensis]EOD01312.1 Helicase PriA essential for oriC/DnaA-independent DNA replication [Caldisalinibacter kiritimatiensis]